MSSLRPLDDWQVILAVAAAYETGILQELEPGGTAGDIRRRTGTAERATRIVLDALVDAGVALREPGGRLGLDARGRDLLHPPTGTGDRLAGILLAARDMAAQTALPDLLRGGLPRHDVSAGDPALRHRFMRAMRDVAAPRARVTCAALPPGEGGRLLDVGGAPGSYAIPFARAGWTVTVVDLEETLRLTRGELEAAGVACVPGDITAGLPDGPWDCVYLGNVVHLFGPAEAAALVTRAGAALGPGGRLAVQEVVTGLAAPAPWFALTMLAGTEAGEAYGLPTLTGWMADAGCPVHAVVAVEPGRHHLLVGERR